MKDPKTIQEAVEQLQASIQAALPGMGVTVSINLVPLNNKVQEPVNGKKEKAVKPAEKKAEPVSLDKLRTLLNAYVKAAGKDKALSLVGKYSNGTQNPADIPEADYPKIISEMGGVELEPEGDR
jgi:hypothetical protein